MNQSTFTPNGVLVIISRIKTKFNFLKSLRFRILLLGILIGIVPCIFLKHGILDSYEDRAVELKKIEIKTQCGILANQLSNTNYLTDPSSEVINAQLTQLSAVYDGRIMLIDDNFKVVKDTYGISTGKTIVSEEIFRCYKGEEVFNYDDKNRYIEMAVQMRGVSEREVRGIILISVSTDNIVDSLEIMNRKALILQIALAVIIIGIAAYFSISFVKPLGKISQNIEDMASGFGEEELVVKDYIETEKISLSYNKMLSRMKVLDDSRQEFVSNVSHELKTPITSMKVLADSLLMQEDVPNELYKEFMTDITAEIDRESKIIDDLLSLVKMDKTATDLNISQVDINELLELILKRLRPIAAKRNIELVLESFRSVTAEVDEVKLTLALSNLVENAIKYNVDNGWVHVSLNADHKFFYVKIADSGIGIPEESLEHIFERFYRVDKSHSREIGGTGLGLAITRSAILMHRGAVKVESKENEGTTFNVRIPLNYLV